MRAALIGAGHIARQHLACLRTLPGVETVAVCDLSPAMAGSAAERFGVPAWYVDHRQMLAEAAPDVVHVCTPPPSHFPLAKDALASGCHVIVEKPVTETLEQAETLLDLAARADRAIVENHNYVFNDSTRRILSRIESGAFGRVLHVEVFICLDIVGPGSPFADPNLPHPTLRLPGGAIADFLPHLASLAHAFVGPVRVAWPSWSRHTTALPYDEFRALAECARGTAVVGFSSNTQPDAFWVRVYGERSQAVANLFETRLTFARVRGGPKPLRPMVNALDEGWDVAGSAFGTLNRKLSGGPGAYEGLWTLLRETYAALASGTPVPVRPSDVLEVSRMIAAFAPRVRQP